MRLVLNSKSANRMLYVAVFFMFIMGFLIHDIGFPIGTMAVLDAVVLIVLILAIRFLPSRLSNTKAGAVLAISVGLLLIAIVYGVYARVRMDLLLDGVRNSFRGMATFTVTVCLLKKETVKKIIGLTERFLVINVVVCTIQFFILGVSQDKCNGFFGSGKMNSWTNILLCVVSIIYISRYMNRLIPLRTVVLNAVFCLYIALLAELKFFFFELIFITMMLMLLEKPSWRTFVLCVIGGLVLCGMLTVFISFWKDNTMFTIEGLKNVFDLERTFGYASQGDWGRIGGIIKASKKFFSNGLNLFGMGIGYCGFDTPFYNRYGWLHYNWFSYISIFMEQGWVGIIGYFSFFVVNILTLRKKKKTAKTADAKVMYDVSMVMSAIGIILMIYNSTVTGYPAFFLFLLMGMAYRYELEDGALPNTGSLKAPHNEQLISSKVLHNSSLG